MLRLFPRPHVYDLTPIGGCACGFSYGPYKLKMLADTNVSTEVREADGRRFAPGGQRIRIAAFLFLSVGFPASSERFQPLVHIALTKLFSRNA